MPDLPRNTIMNGDAVGCLTKLPADSVDCVVTSPPYYQLRDYGVSGQIGLEPSVHDWVSKMGQVFKEVERVLKPTGGVWLNLGDSYSRTAKYGAVGKSLLLSPERLLLSLSNHGWIIRNKVIWAKSNPMPTSVADRLNTTYDVVYFIVKSRHYYFDLDSIREPHTSRRVRAASVRSCPPEALGPLSGSNIGLTKPRPDGIPGHHLGKNPGDVWRLSTSSFRGAHFATFPARLIERPILATCPERICRSCGKPWRRTSSIEVVGQKPGYEPTDRYIRRYPHRWETVRRRGPLERVCNCNIGYLPGVVLDPFFGSGTVAVVAQKLRRDWIGVELNPHYVQLAQKRISQEFEERPKHPAREAA